MTMLRTRPSAEFSLSTPLGSSVFKAAHLSRWKGKVAPGNGRMFTPESMHPGKRFSPINILFYAIRDSGKSLVSTAIAKMYDRAYNELAGEWNGVRRVGANFWIKFLQERGPLGYEHGYIEDEDGREVTAMLPIDPCDQDMPLKLQEFPEWSRHKMFVFDEIADILNNMQFGTKLVRNWGAVFRQQRKMHTEYLLNTQFPYQVAQNTVFNQVDLIGKIIPHRQSYSADILMFDIHGHFKGTWGRHKFLPPRDADYDWSIHIGNLDAVKDEYDTYEIQPPTWYDAAIRAQLTKRQYKNHSTWRDKEHSIVIGAGEEGYEEERPSGLFVPPDTDSPRAKVSSLDPETEKAIRILRGVQSPCTIGMAFNELRNAFGSIRTEKRAEEWLTDRGWEVLEDPVTHERMVYR